MINSGEPGLDGGGLAWLWDVVQHEATAHFFHGHAFGLVWVCPMSVDERVILTESRTGTASQLLRPHRSDVHEEEPAIDGSGFRLRLGRLIRGGFEQFVAVRHEGRLTQQTKGHYPCIRTAPWPSARPIRVTPRLPR